MSDPQGDLILGYDIPNALDGELHISQGLSKENLQVNTYF
jgi:hypothetical protein